MRKLRTSEKGLTLEINSLRPSSPNFALKTSAKEEVYEEIIDFNDMIQYDFREFIKNTVDPVLLLRDDLLTWLAENRHKLQIDYRDTDREEEIKKTVTSVKEQQLFIMEQLEDERKKLESELTVCSLPVLDLDRLDSARTTSTSVSSHYTNFGTLPQIALGVPQALHSISCPDEELAIACFEEFDVLDERYSMEIEDLEETFQDVISRMPDNGWSSDDSSRFRHVINQYNSVSKNRRRLYLHRLRIEIPHKTSLEIKEFEEFWFRRKCFQRRLKALFLAWRRDKEDLTLRVIAIIQEATAEYAKKKKTMVEHTKQKFFCNYLHERLNEYREERMELMKLEAEEQKILEKKEKEERIKKEKKERARREGDKKMITEYKERQQIHAAQLQEINRMRKEELQERRAIQRVHDMERVQFREDLRQEKLEEERSQKVYREMEVYEKEQRLQRLTQQVNAQVKYDPQRVLEPTKTTIAHTRVEEFDEKDAQEPLFHVYTYNIDQVAQDKRVKIEAALRRANLHMTEYGRNILSSVQPPSKPRKDMQSTVFNQT